MADFCPKCGHRFKYAGGVNLKDPVHVIGLGICAIIIISVIYYILSLASGESAIKAQEHEITKSADESVRSMRKSVEALDEATHPKK
jgi:membrane-anchored glycerophosphoryl diester phosphodiesterase (GDPDase)